VGEERKKQDESEDEGCKHVAQQIFLGGSENDKKMKRMKEF